MKAKGKRAAALGILALLLLAAGSGWAQPHNMMMEGVIDGVNGPVFTLAARTGHISTPDGNSILVWGYALGRPGRCSIPDPP